MIKIQQLTDISFDRIYDTFNMAFSDYVEPFTSTLEQLKYTFERRGYELDLSFGAFDGDELIGVTLNGLGRWNNESTIYDTGTGVIKQYRKQGVATQLFVDSFPIIKEHKINQYLLEVVKTNTNAVDLYKKLGFTISRNFDFYKFNRNELAFNYDKKLNNVEIRTMKIPNWELFKTFWDFEPSWQNSIDSMNRKIDNMEILGAYIDGKLYGYGIIEKHTGDIPQLAIEKNNRGKGLATKIFYELLNSTSSEHIKFINIDEQNEPFKHFANKLGINAGLGQYEMVLKF